MSEVLLRTTVVGSYPQPDWLVDRDALKSQSVPRVRARELWRVDEALLEQAQDDATLLAIRDMERAGIDIISDGEIRRESYSNRLATALDGIDVDNPGQVIGRTGHPPPSHASSGGSAGATRSRSATSSSCAGTRIVQSRSPCPARSRSRARRRTSSTGTRKRSRWTTRRRSTPKRAT